MSEEHIKQGKSSMVFEIRPLQPRDVPQVASLHAFVFPDYFLTHMGVDFLTLFYKQFTSRTRYGLVACQGGQIVGFVAGTSQPENFFRSFYRAHFLRIALITLRRFFSDGFIRKEIWKRMASIQTAFLSLFSSREQPLQSGDLPGGHSADLLGIGVHPDYRGGHIAEQLVDQFKHMLAGDGVKLVSLTVRSENGRAIRFYEKTGWQVLEKQADRIIYVQHIE